MGKPALFLLHYAGGNCYSFQFLTPLLKEFDVYVPELPGRGRRVGEPLLKDFDSAASDLYNQITPKIATGPFLLFGHSMGAYLGLRIANMLEKAGKCPLCLFVSGNAGPGIRENRQRYRMGEIEFKDELKKLGGMPEEIFSNSELFDFFEPILRADFEIAEENDLEKESSLASPLYAFMGSLEENTKDIFNWARFTCSGFDCKILEGDHFFIFKNATAIARVIKDRFEALCPVQAPGLNGKL